MSKRAHSLVAEIERDALDDNVPLSTVLRKCIALGGAVNSDQLREWAGRELRGYSGDDETPAYRIVAAPIKIDAALAGGFITGQQISPRVLPDFVQEKVSEELPLRMGVGELEAGIQNNDKPYVNLALPMSMDIAA